MTPRALLVTPLLLLAGPALADVQENLSYRHYEVVARPDQPLYRQIEAVSPVRQGNRTFHGYTSWNVQWRFQWHIGAGGSCRIASASTRVDGVITLPTLAGASAGQSAAFDRYLAALREHELGHFRIGVEAARAIDAGLLALPAERDCPTLERTANAAARQLLDRHLEREREYDRSTNHGRTQGAWLTQ